jgi:two-component system nitrogen regulation response regulator NtrX
MERVAVEVENALARARLEGEVKRLRRDLGTESPLIGTSAPMRELRDQIARVASIPSPVLIVGESGTGKELVAREVHRLASDDPKRAFVAVNSGALPENLIESELFGFERGAFTGASRTHRGAFERAARGTLFLDEIGELPLAAQAKLLRVLEERTVNRLGAESSINVTARVIAATTRDLEVAVDDGAFRQDLLFRLNVHVLRVPPLRDRRSDVPDLVRALLEATCSRFSMKMKTIAPEALERLMACEWKRNNVRELRNVVERMVIASDAPVIGAKDVPADLEATVDTGPSGGGRTYRDLKMEAERRIILAALERNDGQISATAEDLGLADHASLLKIMRRLGVKRG